MVREVPAAFRYVHSWIKSVVRLRVEISLRAYAYYGMLFFRAILRAAELGTDDTIASFALLESFRVWMLEGQVGSL